MVVQNLVFDLLVYGALLLGLIVDLLVPSLHGAATLIAVSAATYFTAEDSCIALGKRGLWTQESLATALALSVTAFGYYWWHNDSDIIAVVLHIGMMMASLMILIAVVAAFSATVDRKAPLAILGLLLTAIGSLLLGAAAGALVLLLTSATVALPIKAGVLVAGAVLWKIREAVKPPAENEAAVAAAVAARTSPPRVEPSRVEPSRVEPSRVEPSRVEPSRPAGVKPETPAVVHPGSQRIIIPMRGSMLDRFLPILILGAIAFAVLGNAVSSAAK